MWSVIDSNHVEYTPYAKGKADIKRILEQKTVGSKRFSGFGILNIPPGGVFPPHTHPEREEIYYVLSGLGTIIIEDKEIPSKEGLVVYVSGDVPHGLKNETGNPFLVIFVHVQV